MAFALNSYPVIYRAKFEGDTWTEEYIEKDHKTYAEEAKMGAEEYAKISNSRNFFNDMPLVNYTSQYGLGCFEGLKALPLKDGGVAMFRPEQNATRFFNSMKGLKMPPFPEGLFLKACTEVIKRNANLGFVPPYKAEWEKDSFMTADSIYIRPFTLAEAGIGVNISQNPWVIIVTSPVSSYFSGGSSEAVVTERVRATPKGTGWIKAAANYTIAALAKNEAIEAGFMECIFLDAAEHKYVEEGSSCNIFFYLNSGELVTPDLGDTILPGITRSSIIELARDRNIKTTERKISIDEVFQEARECFVTGTAAGVTPLEAITYNGKKVILNNRKTGELTADLQNTLKSIQYGTINDDKGWLKRVI